MVAALAGIYSGAGVGDDEQLRLRPLELGATSSKELVGPALSLAGLPPG